MGELKIGLNRERASEGLETRLIVNYDVIDMYMTFLKPEKFIIVRLMDHL